MINDVMVVDIQKHHTVHSYKWMNRESEKGLSVKIHIMASLEIVNEDTLHVPFNIVREIDDFSNRFPSVRNASKYDSYKLQVEANLLWKGLPSRERREIL